MVLATVEIYPLHHPRVESSASELKKKKWCSQTLVLSILWSKSQKWSVWKKTGSCWLRSEWTNFPLQTTFGSSDIHTVVSKSVTLCTFKGKTCKLCLKSLHLLIHDCSESLCFWLFPHCPVFILQIKMSVFEIVFFKFITRQINC